MSVEKTRLLNLLEMRFDYQSARNVLNNWLRAKNIKDDRVLFSDGDLRSFLLFLKEEFKDRDAEHVHAAIERLILTSRCSTKMIESPRKVYDAQACCEALVEATVVAETAIEPNRFYDLEHCCEEQQISSMSEACADCDAAAIVEVCEEAQGAGIIAGEANDTEVEGGETDDALLVCADVEGSAMEEKVEKSCEVVERVAHTVQKSDKRKKKKNS